MRRDIQLALSLVLGVALMGCEVLWSLGSRGQLKRDITEIFQRYSVTVSSLNCNMVGATRDAVCTMQISPPDVTKLVKGLSLKALNPASFEDEPWFTRHALQLDDNGCASQSAFRGSAVQIFYSPKLRPEVLRVGYSAFDYLHLYQVPGVPKVCVAVSYAYG